MLELAWLVKLQHQIQLNPAKIDAKQLAYVLDLTLLDENATPSAIETLVCHAEQAEVAAVCIMPEQLNWISQPLNVKRATVANFPTGQMTHDLVMRSIMTSIDQGIVDEIDYVFDYQSYLAGHSRQALLQAHEAYVVCHSHHIPFKVILETGAFPSMNAIYDASIELLHQGCDFLKTSTGKIATGATIPAAFTLLSAILDSKITCGIKVSGGIRTYSIACQYVQMAEQMLGKPIDSSWFRIGTSTLLVSKE